MYTLLNIIILVIQIFLTFTAAYLLLLTVAAWLASRHMKLPAVQGFVNFAIIIPAHNEEHLLPRLLKNLESIDYPGDNFSVHVVADNCTDTTSQVGHLHGAAVYERINENEKGKGYALQCALENLKKDDVVHEAIVIIDADSVVSRNFLKVMNMHLTRGERVIQSYYTVFNSENSFAEGMRFAALAVLHYLRPMGRMKLGGSAGLKGNGMVFDREVMEQYSWPTSITEDIELHMELLLNGERVTFAPNAEVKAEMPDTLTSSKSQATRWEAGRLEMSLRYIYPLIQAAWSEIIKMKFRRAFIYVDALMEHIIPPFSVLVGLSLATFIASSVIYGITAFGRLNTLNPSLTLRSNLVEFNLLLILGILCVLFAYLYSGLLLVKAPPRIYFTLFQAPKYMVWKVLQYISVIRKRKPMEWERTARNES